MNFGIYLIAIICNIDVAQLTTRFDLTNLELINQLRKIRDRVSLTLLLLRVGVFLMMLIWAVDKFVRPEHATAVFDSFYGVGGIGTSLVYLLGSIQLAILVGFLLGYRKRITYGLVLLMHTLSTLISFPVYFKPFAEGSNILFWAAWPVLAACFGLYYLRDLDTKFAFANQRSDNFRHN
ncbi:MAG: hypothetical protein QNJ72_22340 [Pleurocapsa sp. MO_226.B13]|nr:hypothetical protein [Pleurocapsa sp. MO_226.B13]